MATTRPRGFIDNWTPQQHVRRLIGDVYDILQDNRDILPLTLRQIFYMLVSAYNSEDVQGYKFDKTEKSYKRLCETMNKARRARMISMDSIRDDGFSKDGGGGWSSEASLIRTFKYSAERFQLNRQENQPTKLIVWCEAAGMMPQLADAVRDYHVPVMSSGGFDSVTTKHNMAEELSDMGDVEILHLGDHDPSGVHIYSSLDEDLQSFLYDMGGEMELTRLAVTPEQVETMGLSTAPPKSTDKRSFSGLTTQCEAIPPRRLRQILTDAVTARIDHDIYQEDLQEEKRIRKSLGRRLEDL